MILGTPRTSFNIHSFGEAVGSPDSQQQKITQNGTKIWNRCQLQETVSRQPEGVRKKVRYLGVLA